VARGDPGERLRSLCPGHLDELRLVREFAEEVDQRVLVLGEFVHVVRRDDGRFVALDAPPELPVAHDVPFHLLPVEDDERVGGGVAADVTALDVHPEDDRVQRSRARVHVPMLRSGGP